MHDLARMISGISSFIYCHLYISCTNHYTFLEKQVLGNITVALAQITHSKRISLSLFCSLTLVTILGTTN